MPTPIEPAWQSPSPPQAVLSPVALPIQMTWNPPPIMEPPLSPNTTNPTSRFSHLPGASGSPLMAMPVQITFPSLSPHIPGSFSPALTGPWPGDSSSHGLPPVQLDIMSSNNHSLQLLTPQPPSAGFTLPSPRLSPAALPQGHASISPAITGPNHSTSEYVCSPILPEVKSPNLCPPDPPVFKTTPVSAISTNSYPLSASESFLEDSEGRATTPLPLMIPPPPWRSPSRLNSRPHLASDVHANRPSGSMVIASLDTDSSHADGAIEDGALRSGNNSAVDSADTMWSPGSAADATIASRVGKLEERMAGVENRLSGMDGRLARMDDTLAAMLKLLHGMSVQRAADSQ
ncbi:hypothetical protein PYCCODRAFT_1469950 [Trametes coccinea BRFM310]|uniref:Uncharacterized protein n=1 Tax=Trametes coccinea (strain BRFM310) TaxID=1353009 RepID=A0A1Y2IHT3_TRAC3|nr:hypothetical protein PYCCODRAFT_1469950 [Trametes coccinea BRFM310]